MRIRQNPWGTGLGTQVVTGASQKRIVAFAGAPFRVSTTLPDPEFRAQYAPSPRITTAMVRHMI